MPGVVVGVETNQIAMQHAQEKLVPDRQNTIDLTAGERSVQEEANLDILLTVANLLAQHLGQQHEVIIMHPDQITVLDLLRNRLGEQPIRLLVCFPCGLVECDLTGVVVEQRPEDGVYRVGSSVSRSASALQ